MHFVSCVGIPLGGLDNTKPTLKHKAGVHSNKLRGNVFTEWKLLALRVFEELAQVHLNPLCSSTSIPFMLSSVEMGKLSTIETPCYIGGQPFLLSTGHWVPKHLPT